MRGAIDVVKSARPQPRLLPESVARNQSEVELAHALLETRDIAATVLAAHDVEIIGGGIARGAAIGVGRGASGLRGEKRGCVGREVG